MEPQVYEGSPFATYLQEVDMPRQSLPETTTPHIEKLKYLLATSALLSPSLYDALELFPSATSFEEYKGKGKQKELPVATWPDGWTTIGQTRQDRDAWANTRLLVRFLINVSKRAARGLDAGASNAVHAPMDAGRSSAAATRNFGRGAAHAEDAESTSIKAVRDFITEAQRLDRLIEAAMDRFATTELDQPHLRSADSTRSRMSLLPQPPRPAGQSGFDAALASIVELYQSATSSLAHMLPPAALPIACATPTKTAPRSSPLPRLRAKTHQPTASLSELHRHASRAILERQEVEQWETGSATSDSPALFASSLPSPFLPPTPKPSRPESVNDAADPFHPTETYFGGLERKSSTRSTTSMPSDRDRAHGPKHRLRPSVGSAGAFGVGTSAALGPASPLSREVASRGRRRPASMGGWIETSPIVRQSPSLGSGGRAAESKSDEDVKSEAGLRRAWENAHIFRKGFIYNLIAVFEGEEDRPERWSRTAKLLQHLSDNLGAVFYRIQALPQQAGIDAVPRGLRPAPSEPKSSQAVEAALSQIEVPPLSLASTAQHLPTLVPTQNPTLGFDSPSRSPPSTPAARIGSRTRAPPNFAPPSLYSPTTQALTKYESHHATLTRSIKDLQVDLNSIVSTLRILSPLTRDASVQSSTQDSQSPHVRDKIVDMLDLHDSIRDELQNLAQEWAESRLALRQAVDVDFKTKISAAVAASKVDTTSFEGEEASLDNVRLEDAPPESEAEALLNASLDDGSVADDPDFGTRQAILDAALSSSLRDGIDQDSAETVFEAVAGEREQGGTGASKLSREERVRRMKEARDALDAGKRAAAMTGKESEGGVMAHQKMVDELHQVLNGLGKGK